VYCGCIEIVLWMFVIVLWMGCDCVVDVLWMGSGCVVDG